MKIPVFHDDQHGTAIMVGAAMLNGLKVVGSDCRSLVSHGAAPRRWLPQPAGQARPARENIYVTDSGRGLPGRTERWIKTKAQYAQADRGRARWREVIAGADIFFGLSAGGVLAGHGRQHGRAPMIFALANPNPEILPEEVKAVRDDAIMATGRNSTTQPGQQRLCFPVHLPRALDAGPRTITDEMEIACVRRLPSWRRPSERWWRPPTRRSLDLRT